MELYQIVANLDLYRPEEYGDGAALLWDFIQRKVAAQTYREEPPKEVIEATDQASAESDGVAAFLAGCCVIDKNAKATGKALYTAYKEWCEQTGENAESNTRFGLRLAGLGYQKKRVAAGVVYEGVGLRV